MSALGVGRSGVPSDAIAERNIVAERGVAVERRQASDLADILERVLNTGIVIAGEIRIDLLDIELLTIKLRLVITSLDRAEDVGLDWWRNDPWYSADAAPKPHFSVGAGRDAMSGGEDEARGDGEAEGEDGARGGDRNSSGRLDDFTSSLEQSQHLDVGHSAPSASIYAEEVVAASSSAAKPTSRSRREQDDRSGEKARRSQDRGTTTKRVAAEQRATKQQTTKKPATKRRPTKQIAKRATAKKPVDGT